MTLLKNPLRRLQAWNQLALGLVLPQTCADCDQPLEADSMYPELCEVCRKAFVPRKHHCHQCGLQLESELDCFACRDKGFAFDRVFTLGLYEGRLADAVVRMKYQSGQALAFAVGRELGKTIRTQLSGCSDPAAHFDFFSCVPKHWTKRLFTGVNGPEIIMEGLSHTANLNSVADLLRCSRRIRKQSLLSPDQRRRNVRKAWSVSADYCVEGASVLIVDDIMTTGATAHELARALKKAGARQVAVAIVGRARR